MGATDKKSDRGGGGGDDTGGISEEMSKRVCSHMNEDHTVSVFAMAKSSLVGNIPKGWKVSEARMKGVTLSGCSLQAVACNGDMCEMKKVEFPFTPPLQSASELRPRLVQIHHQVCAPRVSWLVTKPESLIIIITEIFLVYGTVFLGPYLSPTIEANEAANKFISQIFGSASTFAALVKASFYFCVVAHTAEAIYVACHSRKSLKLSWKSTLLWFFTITLVGFPITKEFSPLLAAYNKGEAEPRKKTS